MKYSLLLTLFLLLFVTCPAQEVLWDSYTDKGKNATQTGNYKEAEQLFKAAMNEAYKLENDELIAQSHLNLGILYQVTERWADCESNFLKSIDLREKMGHGEIDEITYVLSNLGLAYAEQRKFDKAEEVLRRAVRIREATNSPDLAVAMINLGKTYADQEKHVEAEAIYSKALEIYLASEHEQIDYVIVINCLRNLAFSNESLGNDKKFESSIKMLIQLTERHYGSKDKDLHLYLEKYAVFLRSKKRVAEALRIEAKLNRLRGVPAGKPSARRKS